jgi:hypothetical protein
MSEAANRMRQTYRVSGDRWFKIAADEIERMETAINGAIEALERGSTSAPVLESLKAAVSATDRQGEK